MHHRANVGVVAELAPLSGERLDEAPAFRRGRDGMGDLVAALFRLPEGAIAGVVVDHEAVAVAVVQAGDRRRHAPAEVDLETLLRVEHGQHHPFGRRPHVKTLASKMVKEEGVNRLTVVEPAFDVFVVGVADGEEVVAFQSGHRRQAVLALQPVHVIGECPAVVVVGGYELKAATEDMATGAVVVVDEGDAHPFAGAGLDRPQVFPRPTVIRGQKALDLAKVGSMHLLWDQFPLGRFEHHVESWAGSAAFGAQGRRGEADDGDAGRHDEGLVQEHLVAGPASVATAHAEGPGSGRNPSRWWRRSRRPARRRDGRRVNERSGAAAVGSRQGEQQDERHVHGTSPGTSRLGYGRQDARNPLRGQK